MNAARPLCITSLFGDSARCLAIVLALVVSPALAQDKAKADAMSRNDKLVLQRLAAADMAEIEAGKLAAEKASNPEVKKFGQHMVDEHSKMLEEGKKLADAKGVQPPSGPDHKHEAVIKKLEGLSGVEFDRQYVSQMVTDHEQVLKLAQKTEKATKDADFKALLEKGGPHVKEHLAMARKLNQATGKKGSKSGEAARSEGKSS